MSIIKPKRGTGSPAGSIETNEIAMDTAAKILYVSTDGTDAVNLADDTQTYLDTSGLFTYSGSNATGLNLGTNVIDVGSGGTRLDITPGAGGMRIETNVDMRTNLIKGLGTPTDDNDAATKTYVDNTSLLLAGGTMTGDLDMGDNNITDALSVTIANTGGTSRDVKLRSLGGGQPSLLIEGFVGGNTNRKTQLGFAQDQNGSPITQGIIEFQHNTGGADRFNLYHASDDGNTLSPILFQERDNNTVLYNAHNNGNIALYEDKAESSYRFDILNGRTNSGSGLSPHALRAVTDMSQDLGTTIANSATFAVDYGTQSRTNFIQNAIKFQISDDTAGTDTVGQISSAYNSNGVENVLRIQSENNTASDGNVAGDGGANGQANITSLSFTANVPIELPEYTVAQLNAMPTKNTAMTVYCTDGNAGSACVAVYDGSNWKVVALGATIST